MNELNKAWTNAKFCPPKRSLDSLEIWFAFSAGLSPGSSHDTSFASRPSSGEGTSAHLAPFSTKRLDREFERKLQEVFVSVQLEKVCCKIGKHLLYKFLFSLFQHNVLFFQNIAFSRWTFVYQLEITLHFCNLSNIKFPKNKTAFCFSRRFWEIKC